MNRIYCDISATTPLDSHVNEFMHEIQSRVYGNPSSIHREGQEAKAVVEKSRRQIASVLNCSPDEIIFTSGGSESNNMVLNGILSKGDHFITSSYEHPSILQMLPPLEKRGIEMTIVKPHTDGRVTAADIEKEIKDNTKLISLMYVNNELGTINPLAEIADMAEKHDILFHTDAVQAFGKISVDTKEMPFDFLSLTAHKLYGPKGVGALYKKQGRTLDALIFGGGQESNLRAGTENTVAIGGFGQAAELAHINLEENSGHIRFLEKSFLGFLANLAVDYRINGENRIPGVLNLTLPGINGQTLVMQLDLAGISISFGAACASGTTKTSSLLTRMGLSEEDALASVRISFGKIHTVEDVKSVAEKIAELCVGKKELETQHAG